MKGLVIEMSKKHSVCFIWKTKDDNNRQIVCVVLVKGMLKLKRLVEPTSNSDKWWCDSRKILDMWVLWRKKP